MADPETIYNWRRLDDRITTSGQPTEPQLADIHALGVRHIVNLGLRTHEKALPDEAASAQVTRVLRDRAEWRFTQEKTGSISCIFARSEAGGAG